jgi:uncharacterized membrane protein
MNGVTGSRGLLFKNMAISGRFKSYFLRGLAVLLPTILTIWIFIWGFRFIHERIGVHIKHGLKYLIILMGGSKSELGKLWIDGALSIAGFLGALVIVFIVGALLASVVGRTLWRTVEKFIMNTPFLRQIYPYVKQVTDLLLARQEQERVFLRVVAVEYPREGIWSMGLVTGSAFKKLVDQKKKEFLTVLIPTSPTPFTGFVAMVPREQAMDLDITVEEAIRFIVSAGVITPQRQQSALPQGGSADNE